jgi:hypothetical protein
MRLKRVCAVTALVVFTSLSAFAAPTGPSASPDNSWLANPDFWIATAANLAGMGLFVARVHAPPAAPVFGYVTQGIGIPAAIVGIADLVTGQSDPATIGLLTYAGWAMGSAIVDHVLQVDYRDPVKLGILIPYVVTYYAGIGLLSATQFSSGIVPWIIAGSTCLLTVGASFYARAMGAD